MESKPYLCNVPVDTIAERLANILMQFKKENQDDDPTCVVEIREDMERMTLGFSILEEFDLLSKAWEEITPTASTENQEVDF